MTRHVLWKERSAHSASASLALSASDPADDSYDDDVVVFDDESDDEPSSDEEELE